MGMSWCVHGTCYAIITCCISGYMAQFVTKITPLNPLCGFFSECVYLQTCLPVRQCVSLHDRMFMFSRFLFFLQSQTIPRHITWTGNQCITTNHYHQWYISMVMIPSAAGFPGLGLSQTLQRLTVDLVPDVCTRMLQNIPFINHVCASSRWT